MANKPLQIRLAPITHAYLQDLVDIGRAKDQSALARRWIENEIDRAVDAKIIPTRNAKDFETRPKAKG